MFIDLPLPAKPVSLSPPTLSLTQPASRQAELRRFLTKASAFQCLDDPSSLPLSLNHSG